MKQGSNSRRSRGRGNGKRPQKNHNFDSAGPEGRVRGNAQQVYEKYIALARDAMASGDRIATENYFQHAEHYLRVLMAQDNGDGRMEAFRQRQQRLGAFGDEFDADGDEGEDQGPQQNGQQARPQQNHGNQGEGRSDIRDNNRQEGRPEGRQSEGRQSEERQDGRQDGSNRQDRQEARQDERRESRNQDGRDNRSGGRGEGRRRRHNGNGEGRGEARAEGDAPREDREGGSGRRVPIERGNSGPDDDVADDDGLRRILA